MIELVIKTRNPVDSIDITKLIEQAIVKKLATGICVVYTPHTTSGIMVNEGVDPDVLYDFHQQLSALIPKSKSFKHGEGNSDAHIKSILTGNSKLLIVANGRLQLGRWERVFFLEFDGPRDRKLLLQFIKSEEPN